MKEKIKKDSGREGRVERRQEKKKGHTLEVVDDNIGSIAVILAAVARKIGEDLQGVL